MIDQIQKDLLKTVADLDSLPVGAYNIRANGKAAARNTTAHIDIVTKTDKPGIDIIIKPGTKKESVHIPVVLSESGLTENVYNDFFVGDDCDVVIIAGCGIHNCGTDTSRHDGIHTFHVGKNSKVRYVEKHYGEGTGGGKRIMNPTTVLNLGEGSTMEMEMTQIGGIDDTLRCTTANLGPDARLVIREALLTEGDQHAETAFTVTMDGAGSSADVVSRTVAKGHSTQHYSSRVIGNAPCAGHTECDSIIMDQAKVTAVPELTANDLDASLIHEAAIGKIAGEQLVKLMTLGLTEQEAEEQIISGFLK